MDQKLCEPSQQCTLVQNLRGQIPWVHILSPHFSSSMTLGKQSLHDSVSLPVKEEYAQCLLQTVAVRTV